MSEAVATSQVPETTVAVVPSELSEPSEPSEPSKLAHVSPC